MNKKPMLSDQISREEFRKIETMFHKHFNLPLEMTDLQGEPITSYCSEGCDPAFCRTVQRTLAGRKRCLQDKRRGLHMAFETGQPYTTLCHAGIMVTCVPVINHDTPLGGIFLGKCLSEPFCFAIQEDMQKRLIGLRLSKRLLCSAAEQLPIFSARHVHEAVEFLFILLYDTTRLDPRVIEWRRQRTLQQSRIGEVIHQRKTAGFDGKYPLQSEQELIAKVKIGDQTGAREILNSILGTILFQNPGRLNILKVRLVELLSILSRSASESGADPEILLEKNADYINKVLALETQEEICAWISLALNDFIDSVYHLHSMQKNQRLKPALEYLQKHYCGKVALEDIARSAHLSVSRLCHLFKEQFGFTVFDYLANLRIKRAQYLLLSTDRTCLQICLDSGFANLSYFNRTFKQRTGMTPSQFRRKNMRD